MVKSLADGEHEISDTCSKNLLYLHNSAWESN